MSQNPSVPATSTAVPQQDSTSSMLNPIFFESGSATCSICNSKPGIIFCTTCNTYLCETCFISAHLITFNHVAFLSPRWEGNSTKSDIKHEKHAFIHCAECDTVCLLSSFKFITSFSRHSAFGALLPKLIRDIRSLSISLFYHPFQTSLNLHSYKIGVKKTLGLTMT